jgi:BioD-like phosphotransacetylase family protein
MVKVLKMSLPEGSNAFPQSPPVNRWQKGAPDVVTPCAAFYAKAASKANGIVENPTDITALRDKNPDLKKYFRPDSKDLPVVLPLRIVWLKSNRALKKVFSLGNPDRAETVRRML